MIVDPFFLASFEPAWVKIFSMLVKISPPRSLILCRVNLPTVSYCAESISPRYNTMQSQSPSIMTFAQAFLRDSDTKVNVHFLFYE